MQVSAQAALTSSINRPAPGAAIDTPTVVGAPAAQQTAAAAAPKLAAGGLASLDPQLNLQASALQQTLGFIADAQASLGQLKQGLSDALAAQGSADASLQSSLQQFAAVWQTRPQASGGGLDAQLQVTGADGARQTFAIRGLDGQGAQARESLNFSVRGKQSTPVVLEPGLRTTTVARRLDGALAPLGVRAAVGDDGSLKFSSAESDWPAVRDSLMVKGNGKRFPSGQFNRVRTDAESGAANPQDWSVSDANAMRQTLQRAVQLAGRLDAASRDAAAQLRDLTDAGNTAVSQETGAGVADFAERFKSMATDDPSFATLAQLAPATAGMDRSRVQALLAIRA
jgi:hypothetical protein